MCLEDVAIMAKARTKVINVPTGTPTVLTNETGGPQLMRLAVSTLLGDVTVQARGNDGTLIAVPYQSWPDGTGTYVKIWEPQYLLPLNLGVEITFLGGIGSTQVLAYYLDPKHLTKALEM